MIARSVFRKSRVLAALALLLGLTAGAVRAQPYTLKTGTGDGDVTVGVDGYGAFGSSPGPDSSDPVFDPIGLPGPLATAFESGIALRIGAAGPRDFLTSGMIGASGGLPKATITGTATTGNSGFVDPSGQLSFTLVQTVAPTLNGAVRTGAMLTQTYTIKNISAAPITFELCRYIDTQRNVYAGAQFFAGDRTEILYADENPVNSLVVGISGLGGTPLRNNRFEIKDFPNTRADVLAGTALNDTVLAGPPFNVTMSLRNVFMLNPGASDVYTTHTVWGSPPAANVIFPAKPPLPPGSNVLYGISVATEELLYIDTKPIAGKAAGTVIGPLSSPMASWGLGVLKNKLYAYDGNAKMLRELNPTTGATVNSINIGTMPGVGGEGDLVFRSDGVGFIAENPGTCRLWRFDMTGTPLTLVGPLTPMDGLAFNAAGVLYGLTNNGAQLLTIDPTTATTTLIGNTGAGYPPITSAGLDFDDSGTLYAVIAGFPPPGPSGLYRISVATGAATFLGDVGINGVSGVRFLRSSTPVSPSDGEGTYDGSSGPTGSEGSYGFGTRTELAPAASTPAVPRATVPILLGPIADGHFYRVHNVSWKNHRADSNASEGSHLTVTLLLAATVVALLVVVVARIRS